MEDRLSLLERREEQGRFLFRTGLVLAAAPALIAWFFYSQTGTVFSAVTVFLLLLPIPVGLFAFGFWMNREAKKIKARMGSRQPQTVPAEPGLSPSEEAVWADITRNFR